MYILTIYSQYKYNKNISIIFLSKHFVKITTDNSS